MAEPPLPVDEHAAALLDLYRRAESQLDVLLRTAIASGASYTASQRERNLTLLRTIIGRLEGQTTSATTTAIQTAYAAGAMAVDRLLGPATFGSIHQSAVSVLVAATVGKLQGAVRTVGRNAEDVFRGTALEKLAEQQATGQDTRAGAKMIAEDLRHQGLTAFVDRAGKRWTLEGYSTMVARTTTREAATVAAGNRIVERGGDLVTISSHEHHPDVCSRYDGRTFSLTGKTPGYTLLTKLPPFHPNCRHVMTPAAVDFDAFEQSLGVGTDADTGVDTGIASVYIPPMTKAQKEALRFLAEGGEQIKIRTARPLYAAGLISVPDNWKVQFEKRSSGWVKANLTEKGQQAL
jgi:hypothetical protein